MEIIEECKNEESEFKNTSYYMPHQAVVREEKSTSKVRIVFDASSHSKNAVSLNDCLLSGPNLNPDLLTILLRFRKYKIAFCADIERAFLQISLAKEERDFLRFLWVDDEENIEQFKTFRMTRVSFGIKCSPFLLAATIRNHLSKYDDENPKTCEMLRQLYVDDLVFGADSVEEAFLLSKEALAIMKGASMKLRKWNSNSKELQNLWIENEIDTVTENCETKVLGINWNNQEDCFTLDLKIVVESLKSYKTTKRQVLGILAQIFDPFGLITPFTIRIKCLLQELWERGLSWDEHLSEDLKLRFEEWCQEIYDLKELKLQRPYFLEKNLTSVQIHIFCDASQKAYGAVAYLRIKTSDEKETWKTSFILSKSRVAPLKQMTLPRLELMGALIASRLAKYLKTVFQLKTSDIFLWTDSQIVLYWVKGSFRNWKQFVANRVVEIQENTDPHNWKFCKGKQNPADKLTRGLQAKNLLKDTLWWHGPEWLLISYSDCVEKRYSETLENEEIMQEKRPETKVMQMVFQSQDSNKALLDLEKYSSLRKVLRITAWIKRFIDNLRKNFKKTGALSAEELLTAEIYWVKHVQSEYFYEELNTLKKLKTVDKTSSLYEFNPFLNSDEIICIGGRLQISNLEPQQKHPWIIPGNSRFTVLLILHNHMNVLHSGVTDTLIQIRERYWVIKGRQNVKKALNKCLICRKFKILPGKMTVAPLPKDRIEECNPFEVTGVDFAGPLYVTNGKETRKCYILLCTCAVTRAIHLELVNDLTTESFLLALRRFFSRRGISTIIYSDNAKTFKRANLELKELWSTISDQRVKDYYSDKGIKWKFSVEKGAWWGGFWERMIKSVKICLRKVLGKVSLSTDELNTTLIEIESTVNSRPITYVYSNSSEPSPLTPSHFLIGKRSASLPSLYRSTKENVTSNRRVLLKKYLYRQRLLEHYWKRWKHEYLLMLRSAVTTKPVEHVKQFKLNDIVLVCEEKVPRNFWKLGKIVEVFPGRDGKIRSCSVKTNTSVLKRPVQLLYNLEIQD